MITQPPPDAVVTVFYDPDYNQYSTYYGGEIETVYEIIVYTTTVQVDVISEYPYCGGRKHRRTAAPGVYDDKC